jgi:protein-L-isoaspartate O-methyltransferase
MNLEKKKAQLLEYYKRYNYAKSEEVINAFMRVPREEFVRPHQRQQAYDDHPLPKTIIFG